MLDTLFAHLTGRFPPEPPQFLRRSVELRRGAGRPRSDPPGDLLAASQLMQQILEVNLIPFWMGELLDEDHGGYRLNHDVLGRWRGPAPKRLVTQVRMLWFLAHLTAAGHSHPRIKVLAGPGLAFLAERMWDREYGGFYWEVDARGRRATMADKHAYGQAQALFALADFALATGSEEAARLAHRTFELLEEHFYDRVGGGYTEFLSRELSPPREGWAGYLGAPPEVRLLNTHLHLIEALTSYASLSGEDRARTRLSELVSLVETAWVRPDCDSLYERLSRDWRPAPGQQGERVSYGHDAEMAHFLIAADEVLKHPGARRSLCGRLLDHALRVGEDLEEGGFFAAGWPGVAADDRRKVGWVQAETLLAMIEMYRVSGESRYRDAVLRTVHWIANSQVDWHRGEWHAEILRGRAYGPKVGKWHGPYHTGRALIRGLEALGGIG